MYLINLFTCSPTVDLGKTELLDLLLKDADTEITSSPDDETSSIRIIKGICNGGDDNPFRNKDNFIASLFNSGELDPEMIKEEFASMTDDQKILASIPCQRYTPKTKIDKNRHRNPSSAAVSLAKILPQTDKKKIPSFLDFGLEDKDISKFKYSSSIRWGHNKSSEKIKLKIAINENLTKLVVYEETDRAESISSTALSELSLEFTIRLGSIIGNMYKCPISKNPDWCKRKALAIQQTISAPFSITDTVKKVVLKTPIKSKDIPNQLSVLVLDDFGIALMSEMTTNIVYKTIKVISAIYLQEEFCTTDIKVKESGLFTRAIEKFLSGKGKVVKKLLKEVRNDKDFITDCKKNPSKSTMEQALKAHIRKKLFNYIDIFDLHMPLYNIDTPTKDAIKNIIGVTCPIFMEENQVPSSKNNSLIRAMAKNDIYELAGCEVSPIGLHTGLSCLCEEELDDIL